VTRRLLHWNFGSVARQLSGS